MQRAGTPLALGRARAARDLARDPEPLSAPWPALTAYRLAHLLMRSERDRATLEEADALFAEAARDPLLARTRGSTAWRS